MAIENDSPPESNQDFIHRMHGYRTAYGVVLNDLEVKLPVALAGGWFLDRPILKEIEEFRPDVLKLSAWAGISEFPPAQETDIVQHDEVTASFTSTVVQDKSKWRYVVIRNNGAEKLSQDQVCEVLRISDDDLWVEAWIIYVSEPEGWRKWAMTRNPSQCIQFFSRETRLPQQLDIQHLRSLLECRLRLGDEYFTVSAALTRFRELDVVPESSDLKTLGYFSIIESLLAHAPSPADTVDTITRQLKRNLIAVDHRLPSERRLGFDSFNHASVQTVISRLYSLRSALTHGNNPKDPLRWLNENRPTHFRGDPLWIQQFLRTLTRRIIQAALAEPQLITDLKGP